MTVLNPPLPHPLPRDLLSLDGLCFCEWRFPLAIVSSRSIQVAVRVRTSLPFKAEGHRVARRGHRLRAHSPVDGLAAESDAAMKGAVNCSSPCFLGLHPDVQLLGHVVMVRPHRPGSRHAVPQQPSTPALTRAPARPPVSCWVLFASAAAVLRGLRRLLVVAEMRVPLVTVTLSLRLCPEWP